MTEIQPGAVPAARSADTVSMSRVRPRAAPPAGENPVSMTTVRAGLRATQKK